MAILLQLIASGVAVGMIYAAIAFGYQLTFATSKTLNFGQGEALALGALFGLTLVPFVGYWLMIPWSSSSASPSGPWSSAWACARP